MDTIVAISTSPGLGGIGIIRMSGKETFIILEKIFKPKNNQKIEDIKGYSIKYGNIIDNTSLEIIDEVLVSYFKEPRSYTTENMCEINSHGGRVVLNKILELCLKNGAKLAEAGEFTKRAFLNGRIDLSQAESVIELINAKTDKEAKASINQLEGVLSREISKIKEIIMSIMIDIEASIDYPEYDVPEVTNDRAVENLEKAKQELEKLYQSFENGQIIKEGIKVAIIGKPNAGKSSLLNAILKEEKAIVTEYEGTTRDIVDGFITVEGIPLQIIDTAGIREATDEVEKIGINKSKKIAEEADVVMAIIDSTKELSKEDKEILDIIKNKINIIILNKIDKEKRILKEDRRLTSVSNKIIEISALNNLGINQIYQSISELFNLNKVTVENSAMITNIRHKEAIKEAIDNAKQAIGVVNQGLPIDICSVNIKNILESLGKITGENVSEDILKEIFSKFCLGK